DAVNNVVWGKTDHFSTFGVVSYSTYMATWNSGSNPTVPEYTYGDKINIKANVHNTGDAPVNANVLVYFYEGDPDAGGSYLGSATITGGITQGGAKTAVLYGYTITSSAVDIYVKVDPLNNIAEKSELNNKAYKTLSIGPQNFDSDGDGLTDYDETNGMRTSFGIIKTNPNNRDTDGDGLSDAEEMGTRYSNYYYLNSNPTKTDSDYDGLDDLDEFEIGTKPINSDTDSDGIIDGIDSNPLVAEIVEPEPGVFEIVRDVVIGATFGESGIKDGSLHWLVEDIADSPYYIIGWIGFSLVPYAGAAADARDALEAFIRGDELGAALNAAGFVPGVGDALKTSSAVGLFVAKHADDVKKASRLGRILSKTILKYTPDIVTTKVLDVIYDGAATLLKNDKISTDDVRKVAASNGYLKDTYGIIKENGRLRWLEKGTSDSGWTKIKMKHITGEKPGGSKFPSSLSESQVKDLIYKSIEKGNWKEVVDKKGRKGYIYDFVAETGLRMRTFVGENGYIVSSYPIYR
ncbi:MAG: CARDB domain-containing protein, partial [Candidatus Methanoperedens sp.]|nr:CARDB domain-containing protein [Candidatus Methanoperedens sp.]